MDIEGSCHCGNLKYALSWPGSQVEIPGRACGCEFCTKHGGVWTSHPEAILKYSVSDPNQISIYQFGTGTADFHICKRCGVPPFVISEIACVRYAVVNTNTFDTPDSLEFIVSDTNFENETVDTRLERRISKWIKNIQKIESRA
jgi:hypothetical protein